eukprot:225394_1
MAESFLPSKQYQELLTHGYIRINSQQTMPPVLKHLCLLFYNENFYMNFKDSKLKQFLSMRNRSAICSKTFSIMGFIFYCSICPNGWERSQTGKVLFYLECKSTPTNISNVSIICKMYCPQAKISFQRTNTIQITKFETQNNIQICIRNINVEKFSFEKEIRLPLPAVFFQWDNESLLLADCQDKIELDFVCYIEIINIESFVYKKQNERVIIQSYHKKGIVLQSLCHCDWRIDRQTVKQYFREVSDTNVNAFIGDKIHLGPDLDNGNWKLYFVQPIFDIGTNGLHCSSPWEYQLIIELCQWPECISMLIVNCEYIINNGTHWKKFQFTPKHNRQIIQFEMWAPPSISVSFHVQIRIKEVYVNKQCISKDEWKNYGISL